MASTNAARTVATAVNLIFVGSVVLLASFSTVPRWIKDEFNRLFSMKIRFENHMYGIINCLLVCAYPPTDDFMVSPQGLVRRVPLTSNIPSVVAFGDVSTDHYAQDSFEQPSQFSELNKSALDTHEMEFSLDMDAFDFKPQSDSGSHPFSILPPDISDTSVDPSDVSIDPIDGHPVASGTRKGQEKDKGIVDYVVYKRVGQVDSHGEMQYRWAIVAVIELKRDSLSDLQQYQQLIRYMGGVAERQNAAVDTFRDRRPTILGILLTNEKIKYCSLLSHETNAKTTISETVSFDADEGIELWKLVRKNAVQWS